MSALVDVPPAPGAPVATCGAVAGSTCPADRAASGARLERGRLVVTFADGLTAVRSSAWLRADGDGRAPIDVVVRPGGTELTLTWRDGRRGRYAAAELRSHR